ncbi:transposase [Moraxella atlantae]|uniref:Transposase n=1 Tax=Faucicola atlantae TaxID=34059 RepID=A0A1B8QKY0_9GAMM|nr:transposase [Moraxella atlantae]
MSKVRLCQLFGIPRSSHYIAKKPKLPSLQQIELDIWVKHAYDQSKGSAGARTIASIVSRGRKVKLTRYKASKIMAKQGLVSRQRIKHRYDQTEKNHAMHDSLLKRDFSPTAPNQVWTGDVTYIRTKQGWAYLAVVIDLYARNIVGFAMSDSPDSQLTSNALKMAYTVRLSPQGVLFHSDQGTHYTSKTFAQAIAQCKGMKHSMNRRGNCWDNAPTERFFRSFKSEWMPKNGYDDLVQAKFDVANYILGYYSQVRPHSFNDYLTPVEKERQFFNQSLLGFV